MQAIDPHVVAGTLLLLQSEYCPVDMTPNAHVHTLLPLLAAFPGRLGCSALFEREADGGRRALADSPIERACT